MADSTFIQHYSRPTDIEDGAGGCFFGPEGIVGCQDNINVLPDLGKALSIFSVMDPNPNTPRLDVA